MKALVLNDRDVARLMPMAECIEVVHAALVALAALAWWSKRPRAAAAAGRFAVPARVSPFTVLPLLREIRATGGRPARTGGRGPREGWRSHDLRTPLRRRGGGFGNRRGSPPNQGGRGRRVSNLR